MDIHVSSMASHDPCISIDNRWILHGFAWVSMDNPPILIMDNPWILVLVLMSIWSSTFWVLPSSERKRVQTSSPTNAPCRQSRQKKVPDQLAARHNPCYGNQVTHQSVAALGPLIPVSTIRKHTHQQFAWSAHTAGQKGAHQIAGRRGSRSKV